jgi:hypothetical protein
MFGFLKVPKHRERCCRCPNYPSILLHCMPFLTSSLFFLPACRLDRTLFCLCLDPYREGTKKLLSLHPSPSLPVSSLRRITPFPFAPLTSFMAFIIPLQLLCFTNFFSFFLLFCRLSSLIFWVPIVFERA